MAKGLRHWTRNGILLSALLLITACAATPAHKTAASAAAQASPVVTTVTVAPVDQAAEPTPTASAAADPAPATAPAAPLDTTAAADASTLADRSTGAWIDAGTEGAPLAGLTPGTYPDLFDRMRAGFKLETVDSKAVNQELRWYVNNPDYLERAFRRSELYLYHIVTEIEARGMPVEIALLPVVESAFEPYAYSRARASGLWQFIPGTGSRYGLKQDWWYDGRRDVIESTRAALDYLQSLHDEFNGDWLLAIAAYNCGELNVERAVAHNQARGKPIDFWSLKLPKETKAYVPKLLAMKRLVTDPETLGLTFSPIPNQPYFTRVETQGQIDLRVAAQIAGVTNDEVYELNPAFHRWATDPSGPHFLLLPSDAADAFKSNVVQLTPDQRMKVERYTVKRKDTITAIARHYGTTPQALREFNDIPKGPLVVGTDLRVPADAIELPSKVLRAAALADSRGRLALRPRMRVVVRRGDSLWAIARRHGVDVNQLARANGMQPGDPLRAGQHLRMVAASRTRVSASADTETAVDSGAATGGSSRQVTYTVRSGDTLSRIAHVFQVSVAQIVSWNQLSQTALAPGQHLQIHVTRRARVARAG